MPDAPKFTATREVEGSVVVDGVTHTFPVRVWTETHDADGPHAGATYLFMRFPSDGAVDVTDRAASSEPCEECGGLGLCVCDLRSTQGGATNAR